MLNFIDWSLEKRVNKKVMTMFEKAEDEYKDLLSKKSIIEVQTSSHLFSSLMFILQLMIL